MMWPHQERIVSLTAVVLHLSKTVDSWPCDHLEPLLEYMICIRWELKYLLWCSIMFHTTCSSVFVVALGRRDV